MLRDGERTIAYGRGEAAARGPELLERAGFVGYALITTERAAATAGSIAAGARVVAIAGPERCPMWLPPRAGGSRACRWSRSGAAG